MGSSTSPLETEHPPEQSNDLTRGNANLSRAVDDLTGAVEAAANGSTHRTQSVADSFAAVRCLNRWRQGTGT